MGMQISGVSASTQSASMDAWQQRQQNTKNLFSALQAGDLGAAQKAFAALGGGNDSVNSNSPLAKIGQALQNGDLAGAQSAAQALQAKRSGHHHHHGAQQDAQSSTNPATPAQTTNGSGSLLNLTA